MAQPLIKFFRVDKLTDLQATQKVQGGLYFETSTGVLYVYNVSQLFADCVNVCIYAWCYICNVVI